MLFELKALCKSPHCLLRKDNKRNEWKEKGLPMDAVRVSPGEAESPSRRLLLIVSPLSINYDHLTVVASQEPMHRKRSSCWFYRFQLVLDSRGTSQARNHRVRPSGTAPDSGVNAPQGCHSFHTHSRQRVAIVFALFAAYFSQSLLLVALPRRLLMK